LNRFNINRVATERQGQKRRSGRHRSLVSSFVFNN
jgi:hypothetical protein